jgi:hypothetical protein
MDFLLVARSVSVIGATRWLLALTGSIPLAAVVFVIALRMMHRSGGWWQQVLIGTAIAVQLLGVLLAFGTTL